jgi:hypothetical protein
MAGMLLTVLARSAASQQPAISGDAADTQVHAVLRAFYLHLDSHTWDALSAYVLSPKLLERRGAAGERELVARDRTRARRPVASAAPPRDCGSGASPPLSEAAVRVDGDWADVSVPRCRAGAPGVDQFGMLYFESRWRFIYTDLFEPPPAPVTAQR